MPQPLEQVAKVLSHTDRAANFTFRGRVVGATVSDLERARFNHYEKSGYAGDGRVFLNLVNVLEVAKIARDYGFNHIGVRVGLHEPVQGGDPKAPGYWLDPGVSTSGGRLLRFCIFMAKVAELRRPLLYAFAGQRRVYFEPDFYRLKPALARLA